MVKARKLGKSTAEIRRAKRRERKVKLGTAFIIILLVIGFTVAAYWGFNPRSPSPKRQTIEERLVFGEAVPSGIDSSVVEGLTGNRAVFGQLDVPYDLKKRLNGDFYILDNGLTQLIITNASTEEINSEAKGDYIVYEIGICKGFDCLVKNNNNTNESIMFDIYELNMSSRFLRTNRIGFEVELGENI